MISGESYSRLDRALHRLVLGSELVQDSLLEAEATLHGRTLSKIEIDRPVFITGLPRSGTTILLNIFVESGTFASLLYRDMPFVLTPLLWAGMSRFFSTDSGTRERAHGDGLEIGPNAPESFEEVLWRKFWPDHYLDDRILPWNSEDQSDEFDAAFRNHLRTVIATRQKAGSVAARYVSKNNLNLTRLGMGQACLREGIFVIPFRDPVDTASSLLAQHRRFVEAHRADPFSSWYMKSVGHREFGAELAPVDYGNGSLDAFDAQKLDWWVRYWCQTYEHVLDNRDGITTVLVSYEGLLDRPVDTLSTLEGLTGVAEGTLSRHSSMVGLPRSYDTSRTDLEPRVARRMDSVFDRLKEAACNA